MIELLLLGGSALCVISIVMAVIAVVQTRAPRGAAIALMLGIIGLAVAAKNDPAAVTPDNVVATWQRMIRGELTLRGPIDPVAAPETAPVSAEEPPAAETNAETDTTPQETPASAQ